MPDSLISPDSIVRAVMDDHPETVAIFVRQRMHCTGCVMSPFVTIAEAAANYGIDPAAFVAELRAAVPFSEAGEIR